MCNSDALGEACGEETTSNDEIPDAGDVLCIRCRYRLFATARGSLSPSMVLCRLVFHFQLCSPLQRRSLTSRFYLGHESLCIRNMQQKRLWPTMIDLNVQNELNVFTTVAYKSKGWLRSLHPAKNFFGYDFTVVYLLPVVILYYLQGRDFLRTSVTASRIP